MSRKDRTRQIEYQQTLANEMLQRSLHDAQMARDIKQRINFVVDRIQRLNLENNFAARVAAAYGGLDS